MRSGKWWPWVLAWTLAAATIAVLATALVLALVTKPGLSPTEIFAWSAGVIALASTASNIFRWASKKTHDPPERLAWERISTAKRLLAEAVNKQWTDEARLRDWQKHPLIQVRWRAPADPLVPSHAGAVKNAPQAASTAEIAELAEKFRACDPRRLVILGGPGTGKTTLAVQLLLELLSTRAGRENEPVPVTIPAAQWDTGKYRSLQAWLSAQLYEDYPGLRWLGADGVRQLVDLGHVLPILDGLDELPEPAQATVIERLNASLGGDDHLILTSRTTEYVDAVGGARGVEAAAVLEPLPVTPRAAASYLRGSLQSHQANRPAWARALNVLCTEPDSALAEVAATPLGLWLLRAVFIKGDGDPDELTDPARFPTPDKLRAELFGHLIAALLPPDGDKDRVESLGLSRDYQADDAVRWLAFLAHHLSNQPSQDVSNHRGTRDLEWWRLAATTGRTPSPRVFGLAFGLVSGFVFGLGAGFVDGIVDRLAYGPVDGLVFGFTSGLIYGLTSGLAFGFVGGLVVGPEGARWAEELPGVADLRASRGIHTYISTLGFGLTAGLAVGLVFGLMGGIVFGFEVGLVGGFAVGLAVWLMIWIFRWLETPSPAAEASSPQASLRSDRTLNLVRIICGCLVVGPMAGLVAGLEVGPVGGLMSALVVGLMSPTMAGRHRAWLAYVWATWRLSREGVLPRKLMPFLNDMHRLGLLRAVGRIYQFRHAELQDHLVEDYQRAS